MIESIKTSNDDEFIEQMIEKHFDSSDEHAEYRIEIFEQIVE